MSVRVLLGSVTAALALAALVTFVVLASAPPRGPVPPVWDRTACAWCRMHLGEPGFAAQLHTIDGDVLFFDDPGCLFEFAAERPAGAIEACWFHHLREDRWLAADAVAFLPVAQSPMGHGLGAVDRGTAGALDLDAARAKVLAGTGGHGAPPSDATGGR